MTWQPIETAPKDGTNIDLWAKCWIAGDDSFMWRRFADCYWTKGDSMTNHSSYWVRMDTGWYPTHWMPIPDGPADVPGAP